jgi:hypothetical protein
MDFADLVYAGQIMRKGIKKLLHSPLLHFLALGALIFGVHAWLTRAENNATVIELTPERIAALRAQRVALYGTAPSDPQMRDAIDDYVQEEILYREALALGLDRDDTVIRRRLAQKMRFLIEDTAPAQAPSEAELLRYWEAHRASYAEPVRVSFEQLVFSGERRGAHAVTDARNALQALNAPNAAPGLAARLGDPSMLAQEHTGLSEREIGELFGSDFATSVLAQAPGTWHGPIVSGYGVHLVRVTAQQDTPTRDWAQARPAVLADYQREQRVELNRQALERLRQRYRVVGDLPATAASSVSASAAMGQKP